MKTDRARLSPVIVGATVLAMLSAPALAGGAMRVQSAIWANDQLFGTVLTPTSFNSPPSHSLDLLYNFDMSGLRGQRSVAESEPGDPTYNGGRWWVQMVVFTDLGKSYFDPDGDGVANFELTNAAEVLHHAALGHLEIIATKVFFECPLLKSSPH